MAKKNQQAVEDSAIKEVPADTASEGTKKLSVGESFGALKTRTLHARDLKQHKRIHDDLARQINDSSAILDDNRHILQNFDQVIDEQQQIIQSAEKDLNREERLLKKLKAEEKETSSSLNGMVNEHRRMEEGYKSARASAEADFGAAKRKYSQIEGELNKVQRLISDLEKTIAADSVSRDTSSDPGTQQQAQSRIESATSELAGAREQLVVLEGQRAQASAERTSTQASYEGASRALKDLTKSHEKDEGVLEKQLKDTKKKIDECEGSIAALRQQIKEGQDRIVYARQVMNNPDETHELAAKIETQKQEAASMRTTITSMEERHQELKRGSRKALTLIILVAIVIIAIIVVVLVFGSSAA